MAAPYRADHVGSLLRPPELLHAREQFAAGQIGQEQLREAEDAAILKALAIQQEAGVDVFTDGEYRRGIWYGDLADAVEGLMPDPAPPVPVGTGWQGRGSDLANEAMAEIGQTGLVAGARLRQRQRLTAHESAFLREHAPGPWKMTIPGVVQRAVGWYKPGVTDHVYDNRAQFYDDLAAMVQREIRALIDEGVSYIQLDSLFYVITLTNPLRVQALRNAGLDPEEVLDENIRVDNACLDVARAAGVTAGLHMCRGNNRSAWITEGGYEVCAEKAFSQLHADRFLLEYDTQRAGGFEPLRFVPRGTTVVLGLISSKEAELEPQDELLRRIDEASKYVPIENLAISPQCGFASTMRGNLMSWDEQRRKLELVAQVARRVWG
jgi:5-methyltetrahydropteroyltriglutamate--homocysteine methyltransferase